MTNTGISSPGQSAWPGTTRHSVRLRNPRLNPQKTLITLSYKYMSVSGVLENAASISSQRFIKGGASGPGRPKRTGKAVRSRSDYLVRLHDKMPMSQWDKILDTAIAQAIGGDAEARRFLAQYLIGKPVQAVEISGPGGSSLSLGLILMAIREVAPDPAMQERIADRLQNLMSAQQHKALPAPDDNGQ